MHESHLKFKQMSKSRFEVVQITLCTILYEAFPSSSIEFASPAASSNGYERHLFMLAAVVWGSTFSVYVIVFRLGCMLVPMNQID